MDVRIGVIHTPKEIEVELADGTDSEELAQRIEGALGSDGVLWLTDKRGRRVGIPSSRVAYIEFSSEGDERRVGFGAKVR